jgi:hypothetical protein
MILAGPYGWPGKSLIHHVPVKVQYVLAFITVAVYSLPIIISGIFYIVLVCTESSPIFKNNVGVVLEPNNFEMVNTFSNCAQQVNDYGSKTSPSEIQMIDPNEAQERKSIDYDYNKILMESGLPYETLMPNVECSTENEGKCSNIFLSKDNIIFKVFQKVEYFL